MLPSLALLTSAKFSNSAWRSGRGASQPVVPYFGADDVWQEPTASDAWNGSKRTSVTIKMGDGRRPAAPLMTTEKSS